MGEVYAFVENKKTNTIHILKTTQNVYGQIQEFKAKLIFDHKSFNIDDLENRLITQSQDNFGTPIYWTSIKNARLTATHLANMNYNVCANCVRELYKNDYPDLD
jgi:hypothetical protein